jgi:MFS family permease
VICLLEIQARASRLALAINLCTGLLSAITAGRYGALSDRRGRRLVILIALCGTMANDAIVILMAKYWKYLGIEFFLVGAILDGIFGSFTTTMAATNAYVADCTTPERRAISFAYIQSVFFIGIAVGPVLGGVLINRADSVVILFYCALAVHASFALVILFLVPESVTPENAARAAQNHHNRRMSADGVPFHPRQWAYWSNIINIFQPLEVFWPRDGRGRAFKRKRRNLLILGIVDGILLLNIGAFAVIILYPIYMFNWGDLEVFQLQSRS